jgi:hypothetical protein
MNSPSTTSSEISTPQIVAPNTPPPNHQVIVLDSTKILEDSIPAELMTAHIDALLILLPILLFIVLL